jgi:thiol-disulfide isomerase/thioredoxin
LDFPKLPLAPSDPLAWSAFDLDGREVPMTQFRGRTLFVNIFATWCEYCNAEFPHIQHLADTMKDTDIVFIMLTAEKTDDVKRWVAHLGYTMPFYTVNKGFPAEFKPNGFPTKVIVGPDGRIAYKYSGFAAWDGARTQEFLVALSALAPSEAVPSASTLSPSPP